MSYYNWPSGIPPYAADTHVTDRVTPLNHYSIMNGLARDIGLIQHNINTTHLFASGYAKPVTSGFFKNIDTDYLYCHNLYSRNVTFNKMTDPQLNMRILGTRVDAIDTALINNNILVSGSFKSVDNKFNLSDSGFTYNATYISGGLYNYYLSPGRYTFQNGIFTSLIINSGNLTVNPNHKIFLENVGLFNPTGSISESSIIWNPVLGHDHLLNKINSKYIVDDNILINNDLEITTNQGFLEIISVEKGYPRIENSGTLDCSSYESVTYFDNTEFYELNYVSDAIYSCKNNLSGNIKELDIGTCSLLSNNGYIYASSDTLPTGVSNLTYPYIYRSKNLYEWEGVPVSGTWHPDISGVGKIDGLCNDGDGLRPTCILNTYVGSGNFSAVVYFSSAFIPICINKFNIGQYAHGSSRYSVGTSYINNRLFVYGYEYPHIYNAGIPKWDRHALVWRGSTSAISTTATGQDLSYSGVPYKYSYPFIETDVSFEPSKFWLDGTYNGREPYLTATDNSGIFHMLQRPEITREFGGFVHLRVNSFDDPIAEWIFGDRFTNEMHGTNITLDLTASGFGTPTVRVLSVVTDTELIIEYIDSIDPPLSPTDIIEYVPYTITAVDPLIHFSGYFAGLFGNGFSEVTSLLSINTQYRNGQRGIFTQRDSNGYVGRTDLVENDSNAPLLVFGNSTISVNTSEGDTIFGGCVPLVLNIDKRIYPSGTNDSLLTSGNAKYYPMYLHGSKTLYNNDVLFRIPSYHYFNGSIDWTWNIVNNNMFQEWPSNSGRLWTDYSDRSIQRTELINLCPWNPGLLTFPFGGSGQVYYKHDNNPTPVKLNYTSMLSDKNGLIIPSGTFADHRNYPTYSELTNEMKLGFWSSKTFDWYYVPTTEYGPQLIYSGVVNSALSGAIHYKTINRVSGDSFNTREFSAGKYININGSSRRILEYLNPNRIYVTEDVGLLNNVNYTRNNTHFQDYGNAPEPPSGSYPKTNYYTRPKCPVQHNGVIYTIIEFGTGFNYISLNGSEHIDDKVQYSDLIKYGNTLYGVGIDQVTKNLTVRVIKRNSSTPVRITSSMYGDKLTPKFLIFNNLLYIGIGNGHFLVKVPSHTDLCLTNNI